MDPVSDVGSRSAAENRRSRKKRQAHLQYALDDPNEPSTVTCDYALASALTQRRDLAIEQSWDCLLDEPEIPQQPQPT